VFSLGPENSDQLQAEQLPDVRFVDLLQRAESLVVISATPGEPVAGGRILQESIGYRGKFVERIWFGLRWNQAGERRESAARAGIGRGSGPSVSVACLAAGKVLRVERHAIRLKNEGCDLLIGSGAQSTGITRRHFGVQVVV
jgi:hypothetical protein